MTMNILKSFVSYTSLGLAVIFLLALTACAPAEDAPSTQNPTPTSKSAAADTADNPAEEEVTYEPAFPEDVSDEALSGEDIEQQHGHSHDDDEHGHEHGEGGHSHGDEHDGEHGDDGHSHDDEHGHDHDEDHDHDDGADHDHD